MKANQFVKNSEAVSPVIGVILMVAITVILAAIVFIFVSRLSATNTNLPGHLIVSNNSSGRNVLVFTVTSVTDNLQYTNLTIKNQLGELAAWSTASNKQIGAGDVITINGLTANTQYTFNFVYNGQLISTATAHTS